MHFGPDTAADLQRSDRPLATATLAGQLGRRVGRTWLQTAAAGLAGLLLSLGLQIAPVQEASGASKRPVKTSAASTRKSSAAKSKATPATAKSRASKSRASKKAAAKTKPPVRKGKNNKPKAVKKPRVAPPVSNGKLAPLSADWRHLGQLGQRFRTGDHDGLPKALQQLADRTDDAEIAAAARLMAVRSLAAQRLPGAAQNLLGKLDAVIAVAPASVAWARIELATAAGQNAEALRLLKQWRASWPKFRWAAADLQYSRMYEQVGPPQEAAAAALDLYEKSHLHLPRDELLARAARMTARTYPANAVSLWKKLVMRHPESDYLAEAQRVVPEESLTLAEQFERMERLFARRAYERCRTVALQLWQADHRRSEVGFYLGKIGSERLRDDYAGSERYFTAAVAENAPLAMAALPSYALTLAKLGRFDDAIAWFDVWFARSATAKEPPGNEKRVDVAYDRARTLHMAGKSRQAAQAMWAALEQDKRGIDYGKYLWFVGFWYWMAGDYQQTVDKLQPILASSNPLVGGKARYWTARALDKLGKRDEAIEVLRGLIRGYPLTYYSGLGEQLAEDWGRKDILPAHPDLSKVADPHPDAFAGLPDTAPLRALRLAVHLGEPDTAKQVWDQVQAELEASLGKAGLATLRARLADPLEDYADARSDAMQDWGGVLDSYPTAQTVHKWRAIYPRAFSTYVVAASAKYGAPEWMVYAHMLQESRYKPWLISGAPAYGLLELLDRTALRLAKEAGEDYQLWMLMHPSHNVRWGTQYLGALYKKFHHQLPFAIGSYNGGPMLFEYHLKVATRYKRDFPELIDDLSPHESRNYVRMVIGHFLRYLAIYESPARAKVLRDQLLPREWKATWLDQPDY